MSKINKEFKEKIQKNKRKNTSAYNTEIKFRDISVLIKVGNVKANLEEIQEQVTELYKIKSNFKEGEKIELSKIVDVDFDLFYQGLERSKPTFKVC